MNVVTKLINLLTSIGYEAKFHNSNNADLLCVTLLLHGKEMPGHMHLKYDNEEEDYVLISHKDLHHRVMGALMYLGLADYDDIN